MSVTQEQIASHLGISRISVARALNGYSKVSPENRERIQRTAHELGYGVHSNRAAREMAAKRYGTRLKTDVLAVVLPQRGSTPLRSGAFFSPILDGIETEAETQGFDVFLHFHRQDKLPRLVSENGVDGVICLEHSPRMLQELDSLELPVVTLSVSTTGAHSVTPDDREGARQATQHLVGYGHRNIAYLGRSPDFSAGKLRLEGYRAALYQNGLRAEEDFIEATIWNSQNCGEGLDRLLKRGAKFTGLVCYNDLIAMGAIRELEKRGLSVPEDISVVGFDDLSVQEHFSPSLTSLFFDRVKMGRRAVQMLSQGAPDGAFYHESLPVQLHVRASSRRL